MSHEEEALDLTGLTEKKNKAGTRYFEDEDGETIAKECTKCAEVREVTYYARHKNKLGGRNPTCKECERKYREENREYRNEYSRKYYEENREYHIAYSRKYRKENRERIRGRERKYREENWEYIRGRERKYREENREHRNEYNRKWREENREYTREIARKYHEENREYRNEYNRKWREENRDYCLEYKRKWREENRDYTRKLARKYREENRERLIEYNRKWREENLAHRIEYGRKYREENRKYLKDACRKYREKNPARVRLNCQRRRARKSALPDDLTAEQHAQIHSNFNERCALTGEEGDFHLDHVIPIAVGHGGTTYGNMIPLRSDLNLSKNNRNLFEWFYANKERFDIDQRRFDELIEYLADINGMTTEEYEEYVNWCHANPRKLDVEETQEGGEVS